MIYKMLPPSRCLSSFLYGYYTLETHQNKGPQRLTTNPSGTMGMVFNYSDHGVVTDECGVPYPKYFIAGQYHSKKTITIHGNASMFSVIFRPTALSHFFQIPAIEFTNKRVDLSLIIGEEANDLLEQIQYSLTLQDQILLIDQYLINRLNRNRCNTDLADTAVSEIRANKGRICIRNLSDKFCLSQRQFHRRFSDKVGLSPKKYARIKRMNFIAQLMGNNNSSWSELVYSGGYYDQSHFIREFQAFFGKRPSEFMGNKGLSKLLVNP